MRPMEPDDYSQRVQRNPSPPPPQPAEPPAYAADTHITMTRAELEELLDQREANLRQQLAAEQSKRERAEAKARSVVTSPIATHGGGPGVDQHQASWSLAEQEAARRGEWLDHWDGEPPQ